MSETREIRIKRLRMRAWHRGMKEMDLLLGNFVDARIEGMTDAQIDHLEELMGEEDQDLYAWISGNRPGPAKYADLMAEIINVTSKNG
ncbi:succinate dehydrogenase assembly factor 2 [Actibacterium pelagium]|uniref:FAD assembly factor SdhE n=1 Tax=Actibacterium pelagium TaxID=2029103 RepID=A0A917EG80_9RHOB|nr:succinate dehydrogenase assembly factor 2 [Actibacterium pelagium]GGE39124.1 hypothetical protein GCM10011517_03580 [Actibacterium pelagium]